MKDLVFPKAPNLWIRICWPVSVIFAEISEVPIIPEVLLWLANLNETSPKASACEIITLFVAENDVFVGVAIVFNCSAKSFALAFCSIVTVLEISLVFPTYWKVPVIVTSWVLVSP